jgi:multidrug efflux pump subunit AcrA (membrane-fusion protein)
MIRWITIALAVAGLLIGIYAVASGQETPVAPPLARTPSVNPYASGVAALGIVEPAGRDVAIVAPESALVTNVHADVGDVVTQGQALFELDARLVQADLIRAEAAVVAAQTEIDRWHALPRAEDIPPLEAALAQARASLEDREEALQLTEEVNRRGANTQRDVSLARFARDSAKAGVDRARAELERAKAGGWRPDLVQAQALHAQRQAEVAALRLTLERSTVRAPRDGRVLRRSVEVGEIGSTDSSRPAFILGDLTRLNVRAQIDEEDIALVASGNASPVPQRRAIARTRGSVVRDVPLRLLRVEPYARPKQDLTGSNLERVDTRVIDAVFEVVENPADVPLYPGQALDVFIESGRSDPSGT